MRKKAVILWFGMLALLNGNAQQVFYSHSLEQLYESLPEMCRVDEATKDTVVLCRDMVQGDTVPLAFCFDENRVLEHIGYRFLPVNDSVTAKNVIVRFIEREWLALLLIGNTDQTLTSYRENGLSILLNDKPLPRNLLQDKRSLLNLLKNSLGMTFRYDGKRYDVSLSCADGRELTFLFPADSELLTGMDKKERDVQLAIQLKNHKSLRNNIMAPDYSYLQLLRDTVYVDKGSSFMIPEINNDLFYVKADSTYNLTLDRSLIAESFSNALLVPCLNNYTIHITHRMYGGVVKEYSINSRDFDDYFLNGYDRYFGIESLGKEGKEKLTGMLILNDRNAGSIHLAHVSVTLNDLLNGGAMEMQLYSNIPQHNLKSLFGK